MDIFSALKHCGFGFILLINVKCQHANHCWHFKIYEQEKFHAELN